MSSKKQGVGGGAGGGGEWKKDDDILQGIIIADSFDKKFVPITKDGPRALLPFGNGILMDFVVSYLIEEGIQEIIVFCCAHGEKIREHINCKWAANTSPASIHCVMSSASDCISLGDAIREIDREGLIRSDFILVFADLISNIKLSTLIQEHKAKRRKEKTLVMTSLFRVISPKHFSRNKEEDMVLAYDPVSSRLLHSQSSRGHRSFALPVSLLAAHKAVNISYDLSSCGIYICSPQVAPLFTDNFDYQTIDDFIRGILTNEEILGDQVHVHVAESGYAARVSNLHMYNAVSLDFLNRWIYPVVPDSPDCKHRRHNVYLETGVRLGRDCCLEETSLIGKRSTVGSKSFISRSVVGANCSIGDNVKIFNSYIWDNVVIEDNCVVKSSLVCSGCHIKRSTSVTNSVLSWNVHLGPDIALAELSRVSLRVPPSLENDLNQMVLASTGVRSTWDKSVVGTEGCGYLWPVNHEEEGEHVPRLTGYAMEFDDDDDSDLEAQGSLPPSPPPEVSSLHQFHAEVLENLRYGLAENTDVDNIALEINASKYKFNIDIPELCQTLMKTVLEIALGSQPSARSKPDIVKDFDKVSTALQPLLAKYWNSPESQMEAIIAAEEYFLNAVDLGAVFATILHKLYDKDIFDESVVLGWHSKPLVSADSTHAANCASLRNNQVMMKFVTWLREADEETDDSEGDDSD